MSYPSYYKLVVIIGMALQSLPVAPAQTSGPFSLTSRAQALQTLKGCSHRPIANGCSEDTAEFLIRLYERGDHALLKPLLDAGRRSDGALSETLGGFYANVLGQTPRKFLLSIRSRSITKQQILCFLVGSTDGGGMPPKVLSAARGSLTKIATNRGALSLVARRCMGQVVRSNQTRP